MFDRVAGEELEVFRPRSAPRRAAHALALVHTDTRRREFSIGLAEKRIKTASSSVARPAGSNGILRFEKKNGDVFQTRRFGCHGLTSRSCSGNFLVSAAIGKASVRENGGGGVMAMGHAIFRTEARHDHVRSETPDHPDDVGQNLVVIPEMKRFLRCLGETEIDRAREELPAMIDPTRGQKLFGSDQAEFFPQLRAEQVLAAVAAGDGKIGRFVKSAVSPKCD